MRIEIDFDPADILDALGRVPWCSSRSRRATTAETAWTAATITAGRTSLAAASPTRRSSRPRPIVTSTSAAAWGARERATLQRRQLVA